MEGETFPPRKKLKTEMARNDEKAAERNICRRRVIRGINNSGNSCFFNVILQNFLAVDILRQKFLSKDPKTLGPVSNALRDLFIQTETDGEDTQGGESSAHSSAIDTEYLLHEDLRTRFEGLGTYQQQDAHEGFTILLDILEREEKDDPDTEKIISQLFSGEFQRDTRCSGCGQISSASEPFQALSLPVPDFTLPVLNKMRCFHIYDTLNEFTKSETLKGQNRFECSTCEPVRQDAVTKLWVKKTPDVLVVHFLRFRSRSGLSSKIETALSFTQTLDLEHYLHPDVRESQNGRYELAGVVSHSGSPQGGHYFTYVFAPGEPSEGANGEDSYKWYRISDHCVSEVAFSSVLDAQAFLLFYVKYSS